MQIDISNKYIKTSLITICVLAVIWLITASLYVFALPKIVNIQSRMPQIEYLFNKKTGLTLDVKNPTVKTCFSGAIYAGADEIGIYDTDKDVVFKTNNPSFKIQPLKLIFKKLSIREIKAQDTILNITRFSEKNFGADVFSYKFDKLPIDIQFQGSNIDVGKYKIFFEDKYLKKNISLEGSEFVMKPISRRLSNLTTDGKLNIDGKTASFDLNIISNFLIQEKINFGNYSIAGKITNIDLQTFAPYLDNIWKLKNAKGLINVNFSTGGNKKNIAQIDVKAKNLSINEGDFEKQFVAKGETKLTVRISESNGDLKIEGLKFKTPNIDVLVKGNIKNYMKEKAGLDIAISLAPSQLSNIIDLLPYGVCNEINIIKRTGMKGKVSGAIKVVGKLPKPRVYGNAESVGTSAVRGMEKTHNAVIKLRFEDTILHSQIDLVTNNKQTFALTGKSHIYEDDWDIFDITTSEAVDLKLVKAILVPVSELFDFPIGPVPMLTVYSGTGSAKMHIKGKRLDKINSKIDGYVKIKNGNARFDGINTQITNINLLLDFIQDKILFDTKNANVTGDKIFVNGQCNTRGNLVLNVGSDSIGGNKLLNIVNTSEVLKDIKKTIDIIEKVGGDFKLRLTMKGTIDVKDNFFDAVQKLAMDGNVALNNNTTSLKGFDTNFYGATGNIHFTEKSAEAKKLKINFGGSTVFVDLKSVLQKGKDPQSEIRIWGNALNTYDTVSVVIKSDIARSMGVKVNKIPVFRGKHTLDFKSKLNDNLPDFNTMSAAIKILPNVQGGRVQIPTGELYVENGNVTIKNLNIKADNSKAGINGTVKRFAAQKPEYNISVKGNDISVKTITDLAGLFPPKIKKTIQSAKDYRGLLNINLFFTAKGANGSVNLKDFGFRHIKSDVPVHFAYLPIKMTPNKISLYNVIGSVGNTGKSPVFFNINVDNYMKIPIVKGSLAIKFNPIFIERYINTKLSHPVKSTGEIALSADINGSVDSLRIAPVLKLAKESDITYLSANFGDSDLAREIRGELILHRKDLVIKKVEYIKFPTTESGKTYAMPMWNLNGKADLIKGVYQPTNINISTYRNLPAKLLNFVFKKSLIKSGEFNCNINCKMKNNTPKIVGSFNLENASIPMYNTVIKNGKARINEDNIFVVVNGNTVNTSYSIRSNIVNSMTKPFRIKHLDIKSKQMDLEQLVAVINKWSIDAYMNASMNNNVNVDISDFTIDKGIFSVDNISYKTCPIEDFVANFSLNKNSILAINAETFKMTGGTVNGSLKYNFQNGETESALTVKGIDSNRAAYSFLGLKNQINGKLDGDMAIRTKGFEDMERIKNLNGKLNFRIANGKMPKLGSLEYLLRAGNLLQSGLTTLSVNGLIDLLKPFKQGSFSRITGFLYFKNGNVHNFSTYSQGTNMSLYMNGNYDIADANANIVIFGKLGKKIDGVLGPVGNISTNTLFNLIPWTKENSEYAQEISKIPDIEYKNQDVRIFRATVNGDINETTSATSFKWVK